MSFDTDEDYDIDESEASKKEVLEIMDKDPIKEKTESG